MSSHGGRAKDQADEVRAIVTRRPTRSLRPSSPVGPGLPSPRRILVPLGFAAVLVGAWAVGNWFRGSTGEEETARPLPTPAWSERQPEPEVPGEPADPRINVEHRVPATDPIEEVGQVSSSSSAAETDVDRESDKTETETAAIEPESTNYEHTETRRNLILARLEGKLREAGFPHLRLTRSGVDYYVRGVVHSQREYARVEKIAQEAIAPDGGVVNLEIEIVRRR